ncbi:MAG: PHP domain-containing protein [Candidatus Erginobacter occultus]|nr:PHP domain-containing protein [Candidatus Erginobacter occultus]
MFAHLHCHFYGSYSDSLLDPEREPAFLKELGQNSVALTDHGVVDYAVPFYQSCRAAGIHPVIGCEVYFVENARRSIERSDSYRNHLVLLAADNEGLANLVRLVNDSWLENNYGETRGLVDWELLEKYHRGLIALSGCFWGSIPRNYVTAGIEEAEREFRRYYEIFGRDFYPELGRHGIEEEERANRGLIELSRRYGLTPVVTNDCHYRLPEDWQYHDILIKTRFGTATDFTLDSRRYYLKSEREMLELGFPPEYCGISEEIARRCRVDPASLPVDLEIEPPASGEETVFASRAVIIDARRALRDVSAVLGRGGRELEEIIAPLPEGISLAAARREFSPLARWLERHPEVLPAAEKLEGIPRKIVPDWETVIPIPLERLRGWLPLRRSGGAVIASAPRAVLEDLGVPLRPAASLFDRVPDLRVRVARLSAFGEARGKMAAGDHFAAAVLLEGILRTAPENLDARLALAEALYFLRRYREAVEQYRILEEARLSPRIRCRALVRRGWAHNWLGEPEQALTAFAGAQEDDPDYAPALYGLGMVSRRQGKNREAREHLQAFLRLRPDGRQAEKARGVIARLSG